MKDDRAAIVVEHVSKSFVLPHERQGSVKSALISFRRKKNFERQHVLDDISFTIKKGEFFGIVGRNGSGKSTLLKLLAGIYIPDKGQVTINGKLTPFIELGVGFNPDLTGRENVYLNGALLGFDRRDMDAMYDEIVEFAELERFMDQKLKNYSSGMQVRLAFSIAIKSQSDILLFDEVLAVGDEGFQRKCVNAFRELKAEGRTIVLVTHDMGNVERFCDRVLILDKSKYVAEASPSEASSIYARLNIDEQAIERQDVKQQKVRSGNATVRVKHCNLLESGKKTRVFATGGSWSLELEFERKSGFGAYPVVCGLAIHNSDGVLVAGPNNLKAPIKDGAKGVTFTVPQLVLAPGDYHVTIVLFDETTSIILDKLEKWLSFSVVSEQQVPGVVRLDGSWKSQ
jgi:ABC-2 type transport system ATP-binding protein